jgi:MraZ protein
MTRGLESCLFLYDIPSWEKVVQKLEELALPDKMQERAFKRALLSGAHEAEPDFQGRILIPQGLREYASIQDEIIIIGVGTRLEIWDSAAWNKYYKQHADVSFKNLAGQLEI